MNKFKELGVSDTLVDILISNGIKKPTPIQEETITLIHDGMDIIAEAETGTGKTLAFLLPIFDKMNENSQNIQTLIVTPTRELAIQITQEAEKLNVNNKFNILAAYGGRDINVQMNKLNKSVDLIIATPGRLIDHLKRKTVNLSKINTLIIDEADLILHMGFKNEIEFIVNASAKERQTLCFSATISSQVKKLAYKITKEPQIVMIEKREVLLKNIDQYLIETTDRRKQDALCQMLNKENPFLAIIFCRTKLRVDKLEDELYKRGYNCQKLHSDIPQSKREKIMKSFKNAEIQYLVATDVASRGIDITGVTHVYNYDIPENGEGYIHRIGRTGRAGKNGKTYLFVTPKDKELLKIIERDIKMEIPKMELEHIPDVKAENSLPKLKYNKRINVNTKNFFEDRNGKNVKENKNSRDKTNKKKKIINKNRKNSNKSKKSIIDSKKRKK
ncbi:DEAD/DEAH box helicase [Haliovirga abyssi]|uniref:DEAD/DEAH box helicase n=1 Tax=Haliovirga abyssi TaxID=2996794 RepID=A0AAU9DW64_9FUSO|nr:DEAD/DEAH box helicase [Haliovirga abyssi]BDU51624.1 DEAD/DEAH box helicase [Haliovirga abyssi]